MIVNVVKEILRDLMIKKTTFFRKILKLQGFRFKKIQKRFGARLCEKKVIARKITSSLIASQLLDDETMMFFDESEFSMRNFSGKLWTKKTWDEKLWLRQPNLTLKLCCLATVDRIISFCLCRETPKKEEIQNFLMSSILMLRRTQEIEK